MSERKLEAQLIKKCREDDITAFGKLINIYRTRLFTYLLRISRESKAAQRITDTASVFKPSNITLAGG